MPVLFWIFLAICPTWAQESLVEAHNGRHCSALYLLELFAPGMQALVHYFRARVYNEPSHLHSNTANKRQCRSLGARLLLKTEKSYRIHIVHCFFSVFIVLLSHLLLPRQLTPLSYYRHAPCDHWVPSPVVFYSTL